MTPLLWLDDITDADRARVGGKAFALARLRQAGLPVPDGFVLPAGTDEPDAAALERACARLGAVAVRSSAGAEDTETASFAGQYRTELDVRGMEAVRAALLRCRAPAAEAYAQAVGAPAADAEVALLVQRFVEPRQSGVAFTRDPRDPEALVVEAHAGRGEALVSGQVTPRRYILDRATGTARPGAAVAGDGALTPDELRAVVALARRAESLFGTPQDVEWAIGGDGPVLLQSRPITVDSDVRLDPRIERLTRANVGEVLPDPVTPLTASTVVAALEHAFQEVMRMGGLGQGGGAPVLVIHRERLYLNLTRSVELATRLPGVGAAEAERLVLGADAVPSRARVGLRDLPRLVLVTSRLLALGRRLPGAVARAEDDVRALRTRAAEVERGEADLARALALFQETGRSVATTHVAVSGASAVKLALLQRLLTRWAPGDPLARVNRLMGGLAGVESAAPALALETLAEAVRGRRDWLEFVTAGGADRLVRVDGPPDLAAMLAAFLARFGHRAVSEGELRARSWREDARPVLDALATLAQSPRRAGFTHAAAAERRQAEEGALMARLSPARRALAARAIAEARDGVRERERTKSLAVAMVDAGRRLARVAGARLAAEGRIGQPDDVLFLTADELAAALAGASPSRPLLRRRRRRHERAAAVPAPRLIDLRGGPDPAETSTWRGTGVSAGIGVGPARVIAAGEPVRLEPGEVLVAPVLDAALGPLLASAAGAVAEIGGMLSHGAVVARELGVPCVVDVRDATTRIRTGDSVLVDGGTGEVRPWTSPAGETGPVPGLDLLARAPAADEAFHVLEPHPLARESVYLNLQDPEMGLVLVASLGARPGGKGEALLALGLPDGRVLFALELGPLLRGPSGVSVGAMETRWAPVRLRFDGRLSPHEAEGFPPGALPLALAPRTVEARVDLTFVPTTPAIDFTQGLPEAEREALRPVGAHHVEQSGRWQGWVEVDGRHFDVEGTGSRDHSWGRRDWDAAEWWRLFTARFGDDLAVHALAVSVGGRVVEGGFVWRHGDVERIRRVAFAAREAGGRLVSLDLELGTARGALYLTGQVERTLTVPVQLARSLGRQLAGRPWRLLLHENYTRYTYAGREGRGMAEITERP